DQRLATHLQTAESVNELSSLRLLKLPLIHDDQVPFAQALGNRRAHRALSHLLGQVVRPVARLWPVGGAATFPERRAQAGNSRPSRAFLTPKLSPRARNIAARFRSRRARPPISQKTAHRFVNQWLVEGHVKHDVSQLDLANFLTRQVQNFDCWHNGPPFRNNKLTVCPA